MVAVAIVVSPLSEHELLLLFAQLFLLLLTARGLGELAKRAGLPAVLGELLAGVVLGPSLFGALAPGLFVTVFPQTEAQYHLLDVVGWIGLVLLLVVTGLEMDLELIGERARPATLISLFGIAIPFATGFGLGYVLPAQFLAPGGQRFVFSLFIAVAMSISAIPVIAKVLLDMNVIDRDIGQITIAAGMIDDTVGWILLSIVAGLATAGSGAVFGAAVETVASVLVFLAVAFTLGRRAAERVMRFVDTYVGDEMAKITTVVVLALGVGTITHFMGVEAVLGAFVVGVLFGHVRRFDRSARRTINLVTLGVFAPVFFAIAGLRVDLTTMLDPAVFAAGLAVLTIAIAGKFIGASVGAKTAGLSNWEGVALGAGMNARGAIELIVAVIGLGIGVLTVEMYSIIVMVAVVTSLMAPPMLRWSLAHIEPTEEEKLRREREQLEREGFLGDVVRVLLPTRCSVDSQFAAQLVGRLARSRELEVTCMYVSRPAELEPSGGPLVRRLKRVIGGIGSGHDRAQYDGGAATLEPAEDCLDLMETQLALADTGLVRGIVRTAEADVSTTVLDEAAEYDLLVVGTSRDGRGSTRPLFDTEIDDLIRETPCPLMVVVSNRDSDEPVEPAAFRRILFPTVGLRHSRHAAEVAFALAVEYDATTEVVHVVNRSQVGERFARRLDLVESMRFGEDIVDREAEIGRRMDADVRTNVLLGDMPEREIVARAIESEADLIVLGSELRPTSYRAFFGYRVEYVAENAPCPVVIISSV